MEFTQNKLSHLCDIVLGRTPSRSNPNYWGKGTTWVSISDLKEKYITKTKEQITKLGAKESNSRLIPEGTLLLSFKLSIGKRAFAGKDLYTNEAISALPIKNKTELDKEYLYYILGHIPLVGGNQAAMGKTLNKKSLSELVIPYPKSITDQERIAKVLSNCEQLIQWRKESIQLLDDYLESTFLEMFGDPTLNRKAFAKVSISKLCEVGTGGTPSRKKEAIYYGGRHNWVKTTSVNGSRIYNSLEKITDRALEDSNCKIYPKKTILVAMYGQGKTRGNVGFLETEAATNQACAAIKPGNKIDPEFLFYQLKYSYPSLRALGRGGNQENLNLSLVKSFKVIVPDIKLQNKFIDLVKQKDELQKTQQVSLEEMNNLYSSFSQKAFNGQLKLL